MTENKSLHTDHGSLWAGKSVALLGGSFNPAHIGHKHIAELALEKLGCDFVWWMVSPGNPLKSNDGMAEFSRRYDSALEMVDRHPNMLVTDIETQMGTRYTYDGLSKLLPLFPKTKFVWIMGEDNLQTIDQWHRWEDIFSMLPVAIFHRPLNENTEDIPVLKQLNNTRLPSKEAGKLLDQSTPKWVLMETDPCDESSTRIRQSGEWKP